MSKVLFEITEDHLETGLRGVPVGYCTTSYVDPQKGLFYRGKAISDLRSAHSEEVIFLLKEGHLPSKEELAAFKSVLSERGGLKDEVISHIESLPRQGHPMKLFAAALLILGAIEGENDYEKDTLTVIAKIPQLAAVVINHHAGWGKTPSFNPQLGYMENFAQMVNCPNCDKVRLKEVFELFDILHLDHGGGNLSTFVGKAVASGHEDLFGSLTSAMCALAGPLHGRANQDSLRFVEQTLKSVGENATQESVEAYLRECLDNHRLIYGFGHAVLRVEDPRATIMYDYSEKHFGSHPLVKTAMLLRRAGPKILSDNPKIQDPFPNIDAISGSMLTAAGFGYPEFFTILFGLSRSVGIALQIVYERCRARQGKGTPIIRPKYIYKSL